MTKHDVVYDLGSGDGRVIIAAAHYGARGVGVDIDPQRIKEGRANARNAGVANRVQFLQQDLFTADLREATVVTLYLLPKLNVRLRPKLLSELRPGTRVVSHDFTMEDWHPDKELQVPGSSSGHALYYWIIPAETAGIGHWSLPTPTTEQQYTLRLQQHFQGVPLRDFVALARQRLRSPGASYPQRLREGGDAKPLAAEVSSSRRQRSRARRDGLVVVAGVREPASPPRWGWNRGDRSRTEQGV